MNSLMAMFRFEWKRLMTPGRSFWWLVVAAFPVLILILIQEFSPITDVSEWQDILGSDRGIPPWEGNIDAAEAQQHIDTLLTVALYFLAPSIACMLGSLLTAAPSVASELEQHSFTYIATRPNGLFHLVIGKYLVAFLWSATATMAGLGVALYLAKIAGKTEATWALMGVSVLSAMAYSALFMMIGTLFHQRAMMFCVAYTAGVELFLGFFPAVINRFTIQYRLRSLLFDWTTQSDEIRESKILDFVAASEGPMLQVLWLVSLTALFLAISLVSVHVREFTSAAESDI